MSMRSYCLVSDLTYSTMCTIRLVYHLCCIHLAALPIEAIGKSSEFFYNVYYSLNACSSQDYGSLTLLQLPLFPIPQDGFIDVPVILVGNKIDQFNDRMVLTEEGQKRCREIACACFHEVSVRESVDQVLSVFRDAYRFWRVLSKFPKLKRSTSDVHDLHNEVELILSPDSVHSYCDCDLKSDGRRKQIYILGKI